MPDPDPLPETWTTRDFPILRVALRLDGENAHYIALAAIQAETRLDANQMRAGLRALASASPPYLTAEQVGFGDEQVDGHVTFISSRAREIAKTWPTNEDALDRLVAAIEALADREPNPANQSLLRSAARLVLGMAGTVATTVVSTKLGTAF